MLFCITLKSTKHESQKGLATGSVMRIVGLVSSGLGRAHVFMAQKHYQEQFQELMDTSVWPGTLNISVSGESLKNYIALRIKSGIDTLDASAELNESANEINLENIDEHRIRGFLRDGVSFGGATAFRAKIIANDQTTDCAVLIPDLTRHYDVVEIISPKFLREHLAINDGDEVTIDLV